MARLTVNRKLLIPNLFYIILLIIVAVLFFNVKAKISRLQEEQGGFQELITTIRQTAESAESYLNGQLEFENLEKKVGDLITVMKEIGRDTTKTATLWKAIEQFRALELENANIGKEFDELTANSIKQSDGYIEMVSKKLAGEDTRAEVSTLERLVIIGANINTSSNYELKIKFQELKEDINRKEEMLAFVDTLLRNVEKDIKDLTGTPFLVMAQTAKKSNLRIKEITLKYIENMTKQNALHGSVAAGLEMSMNDIDKELAGKSVGFFKTVLYYFEIVIAVFLIGLVIGTLFIWLIARGISRSIKLVAEGAKRFAIGDIELADMNWEDIKKINARGDELGDTGRAFGKLIGYLKEKVDAASKIAAGDLSMNIKVVSEADALGKALHSMVESLNDALGQVNNASGQVDSGSAGVSDSSQNLSQGATEQAASLEEITSSVTELASQTKMNAENAVQANQLATQARQNADNGNGQMKELIEAMQDISVSSKEIAKIIKIIDDIAFQTNLLALNAAVEAARAGKHGKGFAVVAQEVRNLAGRSAKAAQETGELIDNAVKRVENGSELVNRTADGLSEIVDGATKVADLVGEIAAASNEQAQGIGQINQGLGQVEQVTQQNTANAEETAAAAQELTGLARQLRRIVARFKLKINTEAAFGASDEVTPLKRQLSRNTEHHESLDQAVRQPVEAKELRPSDVIALDDADFGKY